MYWGRGHLSVVSLSPHSIRDLYKPSTQLLRHVLSHGIKRLANRMETDALGHALDTAKLL